MTKKYYNNCLKLIYIYSTKLLCVFQINHVANAGLGPVDFNIIKMHRGLCPHWWRHLNPYQHHWNGSAGYSEGDVPWRCGRRRQWVWANGKMQDSPRIKKPTSPTPTDVHYVIHGGCSRESDSSLRAVFVFSLNLSSHFAFECDTTLKGSISRGVGQGLSRALRNRRSVWCQVSCCSTGNLYSEWTGWPRFCWQVGPGV